MQNLLIRSSSLISVRANCCITMMLFVCSEDCVHWSGIVPPAPLPAAPVERRDDDEMIAHFLMENDGTTTQASVSSSSIAVQ